MKILLFIISIHWLVLIQDYEEVRPIEADYGFSEIDSWPKYPNGLEGIYYYIIESLEYPEDLEKEGTGGKVVVKYTVNEEGETEQIEVLQSVHPILDSISVSIINSMDQWIPAMQKGKPIKCTYIQPISFNP